MTRSTESAPAFGSPTHGVAPHPEAGSRVSLRAIGKSFGDKAVLSRVDLDVEVGQFLAIVGKSGCGKSTLLRLVAGLDEPTSGRITFSSRSAERDNAQVRIMFQEPRLLPWAAVEENVRVGLGVRRGAADARREAQALLDAVGLGDRGSDWPSVLSGGQKQRVALARALITSPDVLALDEPLGALDALTRIEMQRLLEQIWLERRFTAILVTHDVGEALALADRIILIEGGNIVLDLAVDLPRPRRRGAADFARLEGRILERLLGTEARAAEHEGAIS